MSGSPTHSSPDDRQSVGLIGLGLVGMALAQRWLHAGFRVTGYDIDQARRAAFVQIGGTIASGAATVAAASHRLVLSLPTAGIAWDVIGEFGHAIGPRHLIIDTTTGDPESAQKMAARLAARGAVYLDATISGSSAQVASGDAVVMCGGPAEAVERAGDLIAAFAREAFHTGGNGTGAAMKLVTNLVLGLNRAALAEGLAFAEALGLEPARTLAILRESAASSRVMETKGEKMISGDFTPVARLSQHLKDVRLILNAGTAAGAVMPLSQKHRELLEAAEAAGLGALDNSAIIRVFTVRPDHPAGA